MIEANQQKPGAALTPFVIDVVEIVPRPAPDAPVDGLDSLVR